MRRLLPWWWVGLLLSMAVMLVVPQCTSIVDSPINKAFSDLDALRTGLASYQARYLRYPTEAEGLSVLTPEFVKRIPRDPWGGAYAYRVAGQDSYLLYSPGANGSDESGAGDDVTTPKKKYGRRVYGLGSPTDVPHLVGYSAFALLLASVVVGLARGVAVVQRRIRSRHETEV